jgi:hypothetical protein
MSPLSGATNRAPRRDLGAAAGGHAAARRQAHGPTASGAIVSLNRNLLAVEQGFLAAKTLLATRPIFHRTDAAIRGHIFCTFLALVLRKELMDRLVARHLAIPEWHQVVDGLADLSEIVVEQDGDLIAATIPKSNE